MSARGRPSGGSDSKQLILKAARAQFAEVGYDRASIRAIARQAGVDPALVHHYYGTKDDLLHAAIRFPIDPSALLDAALADASVAGERLVRGFLMLWETATVQEHMFALIRTALTHPVAAQRLRDLVTQEVLGPISSRLASTDAALRAGLAGTQLIGLAFARYGLRLEPLASSDVETIARIVGPTLQRYLTGSIEAAEPGLSAKGQKLLDSE